MATEYVLELEGSTPDWRACLDALRTVGVFALETAGPAFRNANFVRSGMYCWSTTIEEGDTPIVHATGNHACTFASWHSIVFRLRPDEMDVCVEELSGFCRELARSSEMGFVLSYQFEDVVATRDARGLIWTWDEPR